MGQAAVGTFSVWWLELKKLRQRWCEVAMFCLCSRVELSVPSWVWALFSVCLQALRAAPDSPLGWSTSYSLSVGCRQPASHSLFQTALPPAPSSLPPVSLIRWDLVLSFLLDCGSWTAGPPLIIDLFRSLPQLLARFLALRK